MAEKKAIQEAIEDLKFMANKQTEPLQRIAFNMAITICEQHLPKELDGEQHLKQMINTYEKAGHKIGVPPDELDKEAKELVNMFYQPLGYLKCGVSSNEMWEQAKKFAIIHCQLMIDYLTKMNNNPAGIQFTERINHYTTLKQKIEAL